MGQKGGTPRVEAGLAYFGYGDTARERRKFVQRLEERARREPGKEAGITGKEGQSLQSTLRRGWYWGSQEFRKKVLKILGRERSRTNRNYKSSHLGRAEGELRAQELLEAGRLHFGLGDQSIAKSREQREARVAIAWALHSRTTQSQKWIAGQLALHTAANVSQQVRRFQGTIRDGGKISKRTKEWIKIVKIC